MNDRFKFRAKLKNIDNWVYGAYLKMLPYQPNPVGYSKPLETEYKHLIITEDSADWGMPRGIAAYEVIPETVGQCTGLHDKNDKLIYEGDIVIEHYYNTKETAIKKVFFDEKVIGFAYTDGIEYNQLSITDGDRLQVIGNIYENKELLDEIY